MKGWEEEWRGKRTESRKLKLEQKSGLEQFQDREVQKIEMQQKSIYKKYNKQQTNNL
jgi:hypothetical protein